MGEHGARRKASKDLRRSERNSCLCGCFAKEEWCGAGGEESELKGLPIAYLSRLCWRNWGGQAACERILRPDTSAGSPIPERRAIRSIRYCHVSQYHYVSLPYLPHWCLLEYSRWMP